MEKKAKSGTVRESGKDIYLIIECSKKWGYLSEEEKISNPVVLGKPISLEGRNVELKMVNWALEQCLGFIVALGETMDWERDRVSVVINDGKRHIVQRLTNDTDQLYGCIDAEDFFCSHCYHGDICMKVGEVYPAKFAPYEDLCTYVREEREKFPARKAVGIILTQGFATDVPDIERRWLYGQFEMCCDLGIEVITLLLKVKGIRYEAPVDGDLAKSFSTMPEWSMEGDYRDITEHLSKLGMAISGKKVQVRPEMKKKHMPKNMMSLEAHDMLMKEQRGIIKDFFGCLDGAADAERRRSLPEMRFYLEKAESYPIVNDFQKWMLDYSKAIFMLLYEPQADKKEATEKLLRLRRQAKEEPDDLYKLVEVSYFRLLIHVLQKNYARMLEIPEYEELAFELIGIIEQKGCYGEEEDETYAFAHCALACYYDTQGRFSAASKYYKAVWQRAKGLECISKYCFSTLTYYSLNLVMQGDYEHMAEIIDFLVEKMFHERVEEAFHEDLQMFWAMYCSALSFGNREHEIRNLLTDDAIRKKMLLNKAWSENLLVVYEAYLHELNRCQAKYPWKQRLAISIYLQKYKQKVDFGKKVPWKQLNYYLTCYFHKKLQDQKKAVRDLERCAGILQTEEFKEGDRMPFINGITCIIQEYKTLGRKQEVLNCIENFMHKNLEFYSMAEYYSDNEKMERYLGICDLCFKIVYQASIGVAADEKRMEYSLNGKRLLSSAIRLRNQVYYGEDEDSLRFREKNPDELRYFSLHQLKQVMPEGTAVIDFLYSDPEVYATKRMLVDASRDDRFLDVFVLVKRDGICSFAYKRIDNAKELDERIHTLLGKMKSSAGKVNKYAGGIWKEVMQPFESLREGTERLWICPDGEVSSLPIETLMELAPGIQPVKEVVYWYSLRDIFEAWSPGGATGKNACVIGNPQFAINGANTDTGQNAAEREETWLVPLPYSEYEVKKISGMTEGVCYTNREATKYRITSGYRYIHVATHGIRHEKGKHPWHESALAFSGAQDCMRQERDIEGFGNGFLSAEEISRMNLQGTELVVLSACNSGSSMVSEMQQQTGLHIAFGVAGVKYIISALWKVDDFAASVLMIYFYKALEAGADVPVSLEQAKSQLKKTTVRKLREIIQEDEKLLPESASEIKDALEQLPEEFCLFAPVRYWGSFVCCQTMQ